MKPINAHNFRLIQLSSLFVAISLILAACAPAGTPAANSAAGTPTAMVPVTGGGTVQVADNPKLGQILVGADGMTLYTFELDTTRVSNCTNECTGDWPPYTVTSAPVASVDLQGQLSTITRSDGTMQVTYNGMPLYGFAADLNPGDVEGDNIDEFGGIWHAARLAGAASPTTTGGGVGAPLY